MRSLGAPGRFARYGADTSEEPGNLGSHRRRRKGSSRPGEPPKESLAAQASGLFWPYEGRARTREWPAPSAAEGQGGLIPQGCARPGWGRAGAAAGAGPRPDRGLPAAAGVGTAAGGPQGWEGCSTVHARARAPGNRIVREFWRSNLNPHQLTRARVFRSKRVTFGQSIETRTWRAALPLLNYSSNTSHAGIRLSGVREQFRSARVYG